MSLRVCIPEEPAPEALAVLRESVGSELDVSFGEPRPDCRVLVEGVPSAERLDGCPELETVIIPWAGVPARTRELLRARPHLSLHNLHHNAGPAAEMAFALFLSAAKAIVPRDRELRGGDWSNREPRELALFAGDRHAVVWGMGAIGSRIAGMCRAFGMRVTGVARERRGDVRGAEDLESLLPIADVLFVCVPRTEETEGRLGAAQISVLPRRAVLVNVARGAVIEQGALYDALASRKLFGAGLDVWWQYPASGQTRAAPSEFPFHELDNVVMSPHRGGHVLETEHLRMRALGEVLRARAEGRSVPHRVDVERGY
jgi:phosphoglycerate dehydrogenase-like enzyme